MTMNTAQLARKIRAEVEQRSIEPMGEGLFLAASQPTSAAVTDMTNGLRLINEELDSLNRQIMAGEPLPRSRGFRNRFGSLIKYRLYRFLWWQSNQIKTLAALLSRHGREEMRLAEALSNNIARLNQQLRQIQGLVFDSSRLANDCESRLLQLESAQLKLQATQIQQETHQRSLQLDTKLESLGKEVSEAKSTLNGIEMRLSAKNLNGTAELRQKIDAVIARLDAEVANRELVSNRLSELGMFAHQSRAAQSIQEQRLALFIAEARKRLPDSFTEEQLRDMVTEHASHKYDALYRSFEDAFRGNRDEIKARQSVYLPLLKERGIGTKEMPILDLGCGRGEWLDLLRDNQLEATGLDLNASMIEQCNSLGLKVIQADALTYLSAADTSSLGAVTSFHMIEHFSFDVSLTLIDEALRVLKPGGVLILETPNPQNLLVGSHTFYLDPTHVKPIPSLMLRFFVEARGFCDVKVWELQPYPEAVRFPENGNPMAARLNEYFYGAQDYAVIGRRP